ncbi:peptidoglycan DD-metalloendopeptidase family protein [Chloroflexus sp.]|uniref:peptidoglycan DD-metalloendopeptidase family protein n=1 Tax=Chloroflexus sp. TaxID=1904827 RepID=UPI00298EE336|nr:peptidoglycan DD-metalloendopeptidase family protein [Chloroflexus sp.]MDW8405193.1 peptidoglycan DD-metalloendopeptidase family protein [Chloroflexus sp.]
MMMHSTRRRRALLALVWLFAVMLSFVARPLPVAAAPTLVLPTPPGEPWRIIQGYACGTHTGWDRYSLDLAQVHGPTYDAPIRAAASGTLWHWEARSGTIVLAHGNNFFTMYTHLSRPVTTERGYAFAAGEVLGYAGDRGSPGIPHLHFTAYTAGANGWSGRQSVPLKFAEGYDLPEIGGCNQHGGKVLTAMSLQDPVVTFTSAALPAGWYNAEHQIDFSVAWGGGGLSQAWDVEPPADQPMFPGAYDGYARLSDMGEGWHTLYVRAWGPDGRQTLASYGPVGYDISPPVLVATPQTLTIARDQAMTLVWPAASDPLSGVAGYRLYLGPDPSGESEWFVSEPSVAVPPLAPGTYLLRVKPIDNAGNVGVWQTVMTIVVE